MTPRKKTQAIYRHILRNSSKYTPGYTMTRRQFVRLTGRLFPALKTAVPYDSRSDYHFTNNIIRINKILAYMGLKITSRRNYHEFVILGSDDIPVEVSRMRKRASNISTAATTLEYNYHLNGSQVQRLTPDVLERVEAHIYTKIV